MARLFLSAVLSPPPVSELSELKGGLPSMRHSAPQLVGAIMLLILLFVAAGCSGPSAKIRKVGSPTERELRADWKNYNTYCLGGGHANSQQGNAILFQLKGDKTIQKSGDWQEVKSDQMASSCAGFLYLSSPVMELRGQNDDLFGYVIYDFKDGLSATIIDPKTLRLFYNVRPRGGGP
ncbi:MAG: hypothetical protein R6V84_06795 [Desulfobacterales bacterium]